MAVLWLLMNSIWQTITHARQEAIRVRVKGFECLGCGGWDLRGTGVGGQGRISGLGCGGEA